MKEKMKNQSNGIRWEEDDLIFEEVIRQEYSNCIFSAGFVENHPIDTMYLKLERDSNVDTFLLLRPDEMAVIGWLANGTLYSKLIGDKLSGISK